MSCSPAYRPVPPGFVLAAEGRPLGRLEVRGEFGEHGQDVGVVEPSVAHAVDGTDDIPLGVELATACCRSGKVSLNTRQAVSAVTRLTVSRLTSGDWQSCVKLQSFIW